MTTPSTPPISMEDVRTEIGITYPISLNQSEVRTLGNIPSGPISLLDLLGKSYINMTVGHATTGADTFYGFSNGTTLVSAFGSLSGNSISGFACSAIYDDQTQSTTTEERYTPPSNYWVISKFSPGDDPPSFSTTATWDGNIVGSEQDQVSAFPPYFQGTFMEHTEAGNSSSDLYSIIGQSTTTTTTSFIHLANLTLNGYVLGIYSGTTRIAASTLTLVDTSGGFGKYSLSNPGIFFARDGQTIRVALTPT